MGWDGAGPAWLGWRASSTPNRADAGHRVVAMRERHDRAEPAGVNRVIELTTAVIEVFDGSESQAEVNRGAGMSRGVVN